MSNTEPITKNESNRLCELEVEIGNGVQAFVVVGVALAEIRDSKLYRGEFATFEDYCREKWGWARRTAYQYIEAARTVQSLPENVRNCAQTESQARELAKVEPDKRAEVLEKAAESGAVTAKSIREANDQSQSPTLANALGFDNTDEALAAVKEPVVTEYYSRLERFVADALENATDKQLISMSVFAATIPKLVKERLAQRKAEKR